MTLTKHELVNGFIDYVVSKGYAVNLEAEGEELDLGDYDACDECIVYITKKDSEGWAWFNYWNEGEEVLQDYTVGVTEIVEAYMDSVYGLKETMTCKYT